VTRTPHLVMLQQRQVAWVRLEVRRQALRVQQLQPQLLSARLRQRRLRLGEGPGTVSASCRDRSSAGKHDVGAYGDTM